MHEEERKMKKGRKEDERKRQTSQGCVVGDFPRKIQYLIHLFTSINLFILY